jgi:hypothetical protein
VDVPQGTPINGIDPVVGDDPFPEMS